MKTNCKICKIEFDVYPADIKRGHGKYCSRKCLGKVQSIKLKNNKPEDAPNWRGGLVNKKCVFCNKDIQVKKCFTNKNSFCSRSCANSYNGRARIKSGKILNCKVCNTEFYRTISALKRKIKKPQFCSHKCRAIYSVKNQRKDNTNIEQLLEKWLIKNGINFESQQIVEGISVVDFFIKPNICLYADGDYWHSLARRKIVDKRQTEALSEKGYRVIRILGSELLKGNYPNEVL